jgi:hypothetical protein
VTGGRPFKNGRFTWVTEGSSQERWIVASCGKYTVIWNFRRCGKDQAGRFAHVDDVTQMLQTQFYDVL